MKRSCGVCGNEFDGYRNEKYCPTCKAEGKKLCSMCGEVIQVAKSRYYCPECERVLRKKQNAAAAKAAKAAGMSYGKYTAMMRGLLRV